MTEPHVDELLARYHKARGFERRVIAYQVFDETVKKRGWKFIFGLWI